MRAFITRTLWTEIKWRNTCRKQVNEKATPQNFKELFYIYTTIIHTKRGQLQASTKHAIAVIVFLSRDRSKGGDELRNCISEQKSKEQLRTLLLSLWIQRSTIYTQASTRGNDKRTYTQVLYYTTAKRLYTTAYTEHNGDRYSAETKRTQNRNEPKPTEKTQLFAKRNSVSITDVTCQLSVKKTHRRVGSHSYQQRYTTHTTI